MKVFYMKGERERAKREGKGLITIDVIRASGSRSTTQLVASETDVKYMDEVLAKLLTVNRDGS